MAGLVARGVLLALLFWGVHPLWLALFWSLQGYPPTLHDLRLWYAIGAFNAIPTLVWLIVGIPLMIGLTALRRRWARRWGVALGALGGACLIPMLSYGLLLVYAGVWRYRAWDVMAPTLLRAYMVLAPSCALVGAVAGWLVWRRAK
jgi:hypothetical protein